MSDSVDEQDYPGRRRGLPQTGTGAVAGWGRRFAALVIDWGLCLLVASGLRNLGFWEGDGARQFEPLLVFAVEVWILTSLVAGSAGQLIVGVVVRRTSGTTLDPARTLLRTILICLVIPPLIFNRDQQGLHDLAVDSITLRR